MSSSSFLASLLLRGGHIVSVLVGGDNDIVGGNNDIVGVVVGGDNDIICVIVGGISFVVSASVVACHVVAVVSSKNSR
jgi:hypothetical protein